VKIDKYNNIDIDVEAKPFELLITTGGTGALIGITQSYLQGNSALVFEPYYPYHRKIFEQFGAKTEVFEMDENLEINKEELPFEDESFDVVTALDVVEHLDDDVAGLKEMFRVLKKGGKTLIFVPAFMWLWGVQDDISNHRIRYTKRQIVERLEKAGFKIERATYANITFFAPILAGRTLMKLTGVKPESENNINVSALNGFLGKIFSAEKYWLNKFGFPFGVSIVITAKKN
jgi:SAM-dependent methyltransferase